MSRSSMYLKRSVMVAWDALAWALALFAFFLVRFDLTLSERVWNAAIAYTIAAIALQIIGGFRFHLYLGRSRIGSFDEVTALGTLVAGVAVILGLVFLVTQPVFSRGLAVAMPALAFLLMAAGRWVFRAATANGRRQGDSSEAVPALVYGAGDAGHQVALLVDTADEPPYSIVGFIDDDPSKRFLRVRGHRVLGRGADAIDVARKTDAEVIVLAVSQASPKMIQDLADRCLTCGTAPQAKSGRTGHGCPDTCVLPSGSP